MTLKFTTSFLEDAFTLFRHYKQMAERAMEQVTDEQLVAVLDPEMNSIALIVKHMSGNLRSRWTNFLTSDGEKPDRNRDSEFVEPPASRAELFQRWEYGWNCLFSTFETLRPEDLTRKILIRNEAHSVMQAVSRQIGHLAYHCGQIVFLAKHLQHAHWKAITIPRGQSLQYTQQVASGQKSQR